jgi:ABC-2 type transport system permease protein
MRWLALLRKALLESVRDWKILILAVTFAPFFVVLMYGYFEAGTTVYRIAVVNRDAGPRGAALVAALRLRPASSGKESLELLEAPDSAVARAWLETRRADLVVQIPPDFSAALDTTRAAGAAAPATVTSYGEPSNPKYVLAAALADYLTYEYAALVTGQRSPVALDARTIGQARRLDDFALYVPALLGLAVMMLLFTAAAPLIREKDMGTLVRLRLSPMTTFEWLSAVSVVQVLVGVVTFALAYVTALACGYRTAASLPALFAVSVLACLSLVGISVLVAAYLRTIFDLATIGCFPFFVLMFFSGGMFPLPEVSAGTAFGVALHANDILPTTHAIRAFAKVLTLGQGLRDVAGDLAAIAVLTAFYYALGTWRFARRHLRAR